MRHLPQEERCSDSDFFQRHACVPLLKSAAPLRLFYHRILQIATVREKRPRLTSAQK